MKTTCWSGNDGGLYRSWDGGKTWTFFENLPLAQYYDVDVDNSLPFYNIYGGLQDNNSIGGAVADQVGPRDPQLRRLRDDGRRRLHVAHRPDRPQHDLRGVAARRAGALRQAHQRADRDPAAGGQGRRAVPLELGHPAHHLAARAQAPVHGGAVPLPLATIAATRGARSRPTSPGRCNATRSR